MRALLVIALLVAGCVDDKQEPRDLATESGVEEAPEVEYPPVVELPEKVAPVQVLEYRAFECQVVALALPASEGEMMALLPDGVEYAQLALGVGIVNVEFLHCDGVLLDNITLVKDVDFLFSYVNAHPEGQGHSGGLDQVVLEAYSNREALVDRFQAVGSPGGFIEVEWAEGSPAFEVMARGEETSYRLDGFRSGQQAYPYSGRLFWHEFNETWRMQSVEFSGNFSEEAANTIQLEGGVLAEAMGSVRSGVMVRGVYDFWTIQSGGP